MLVGLAYHVQFPRRLNQNYVCTDAQYVTRDILSSTRNLGWKVIVSMIPFRGDSALSILTKAADLLSDHELLPWFNAIAGELVSTTVGK